MQRTIIASALLALFIPIAINAQTTVSAETALKSCVQNAIANDAAALLACRDAFISAVQAPPSISSATSTDADARPEASAVEALRSCVQKSNVNDRAMLQACTNTYISAVQTALGAPLTTSTTKDMRPSETNSDADRRPTINTSATAADIDVQARIASLLAQIKLLQQQIAALRNDSATTASSSITGRTLIISRALALGSTGEDVRQLQAFLAKDLAIYPEGQVTGYFGPLTEAAVKRWQALKGIVTNGDAGTTGWGVVGQRTRAAFATQ